MSNVTSMQSFSNVYISSKDCPFTLNGQNLTTMRRAKLRPYAKNFGVSADGSKQDILKRLVGKLQAMDAPKELSEI